MSTLILQILQINAKSIPDVKVILNIFLYDLLIVFVILAKYIHQINFDMPSKKDGHILFLFHLHLYFWGQMQSSNSVLVFFALLFNWWLRQMFSHRPDSLFMCSYTRESLFLYYLQYCMYLYFLAKCIPEIQSSLDNRYSKYIFLSFTYCICDFSQTHCERQVTIQSISINYYCNYVNTWLRQMFSHRPYFES